MALSTYRNAQHWWSFAFSECPRLVITVKLKWIAGGKNRGVMNM